MLLVLLKSTSLLYSIHSVRPPSSIHSPKQKSQDHLLPFLLFHLPFTGQQSNESVSIMAFMFKQSISFFYSYLWQFIFNSCISAIYSLKTFLIFYPFLYSISVQSYLFENRYFWKLYYLLKNNDGSTIGRIMCLIFQPFCR